MPTLKQIQTLGKRLTKHQYIKSAKLLHMSHIGTLYFHSVELYKDIPTELQPNKYYNLDTLPLAVEEKNQEIINDFSPNLAEYIPPSSCENISVTQLERLVKITSSDPTRLHLNCVHFTNEFIESTDGYRAERFEHYSHSNMTEKYLINKEKVKNIITLCKFYKLDTVTIYFDETTFLVKNEYFRYKGSLHNSQFPKTSMLYTTKKPNISFYLKREVLNKFKDLKPLCNKFNQALIYSKDSKIYLTDDVNTLEIGHISNATKEGYENFNIGMNIKFLCEVFYKETRKSPKMKCFHYYTDSTPLRYFDNENYGLIMPVRLPLTPDKE